jgi:hypothetical protein
VEAEAEEGEEEASEAVMRLLRFDVEAEFRCIYRTREQYVFLRLNLCATASAREKPFEVWNKVWKR